MPVPCARIDLRRYIVASVWFGCNNRCSLCMLADLKNSLPPLGFENFRKALLYIHNEGRFDNLILSGGEVTTFPELERYVDLAASLGWFKKIQIQTNGRRLSDRAYLDRLIAHGVNEFFVSIHALERIHDTIARVPGAFQETMAGLANLEASEANVITNTVVTQANLPDLPALVAHLSRLRVSEVHLWNFFPLETKDSVGLIADLKEFVPLLPGLLATMRSAGKTLVLKSFPHCLSLGEPMVCDSLFPGTVLPDAFWKEFEKCQFGLCAHRAVCGDRNCWGLSGAYVRKYGDERELLRPMRG